MAANNTTGGAGAGANVGAGAGTGTAAGASENVLTEGAERLYDSLDPRNYNNFLKYCRFSAKNYGNSSLFTMQSCYEYCQKF